MMRAVASNAVLKVGLETPRVGGHQARVRRHVVAVGLRGQHLKEALEAQAALLRHFLSYFLS